MQIQLSKGASVITLVADSVVAVAVVGRVPVEPLIVASVEGAL